MTSFKQIKRMYMLLMILVLSACAGRRVSSAHQARDKWDTTFANNWYRQQPWLVGSNFLPSTAINQLEMFRSETFDEATIDREFGYAASLGMNVMRVYLHNFLYQYDAKGFKKCLDKVLALADKHHIRLLLTIFDSCWDPFPTWSRQHEPVPFLHNSGWVQSPGEAILKDSTQYPKMEKYVHWLMKNFGNDSRIIAWDIWNEPDNTNGSSYGNRETTDKVNLVLPLLKMAFAWARSQNPSQPITSGVWWGSWGEDSTLRPVEKIQLEESDIISFHCYDQPEDFERKIKELQRYNRPIICTEYMARPNGSTFQGFLPIGKNYKVGMINWGFVDGKSQTIYPWDSWDKKYTGEPPVWFHDIFRRDGSPYRREETDFIKQILGK